jgi:chromosome segregation ATPase
MDEVLIKIRQLYATLETKNASLDEQQATLQKRKEDLEALDKRQGAASNALSARERIQKKYESLEESLAALDSDQKSLAGEKQVLAERLKSNIAKGKDLDRALEATAKAKVQFEKKRDDAQNEKEHLLLKEKQRGEIIKALSGKGVV